MALMISRTLLVGQPTYVVDDHSGHFGNLIFGIKIEVLARSNQGTNRAVIPVKKAMIQASNF